MHAEEQLQMIIPLRKTLPSAEDLQSQINKLVLERDQPGRVSLKRRRELAVNTKELKILLAREEKAEHALQEPVEIQSSSNALHDALVAISPKPAVALSLSFLNQCTNRFDSRRSLGTGGFAEVYSGLDAVKGNTFAVKRFFPHVLQGANAAFTRGRINEEIIVSGDF
jgi:hypothetical protein